MKVHENLTDHRQLYRHSCDAPDMFFWHLRVPEPFVMGNVERDAVLQDNQKTYLWGGRSSEDRQDIYHASSCCKKEKEKKEIIKGQSRKIKFLALFD